jgi:hypothetical protein
MEWQRRSVRCNTTDQGFPAHEIVLFYLLMHVGCGIIRKSRVAERKSIRCIRSCTAACAGSPCLGLFPVSIISLVDLCVTMYDLRHPRVSVIKLPLAWKLDLPQAGPSTGFPGCLYMVTPCLVRGIPIGGSVTGRKIWSLLGNFEEAT